MTFPLLELPKWVQLEVVKRISVNDFSNFQIVNKEIYSLTSDKLTEEQKLFYGDQITESIYKQRSDRFQKIFLHLKEKRCCGENFIIVLKI